MWSTIRSAIHCGVALTATLALSACTGDESVTAPTIAQSAPAAGTDPADTTQWCEAYSAIAANLGALGQTPEDAATGIGLLVTFDRLWLTAGQIGLVTPEEVEANRAAGKGYGGIMQMVADGASDEEIRAAQATFTAATEEMRGPLTSSSTKLTEACQLGSPTASASAAP